MNPIRARLIRAGIIVPAYVGLPTPLVRRADGTWTTVVVYN